MRDVLDELLAWWEAGETVGVGTVVATFRSAPRPPGASMLVGPDGTAVGSVSGGCVEGTVYDLAQTVAASGEPVLERYGVSDDDAFAVGRAEDQTLDLVILASQAALREGGLATPGADVETTPGAVETVVAVGTPSDGETDAVEGGEDAAETVEAVETTPTPTPLP